MVLKSVSTHKEQRKGLRHTTQHTLHSPTKQYTALLHHTSRTHHSTIHSPTHTHLPRPLGLPLPPTLSPQSLLGVGRVHWQGSIVAKSVLSLWRRVGRAQKLEKVHQAFVGSDLWGWGSGSALLWVWSGVWSGVCSMWSVPSVWYVGSV